MPLSAEQERSRKFLLQRDYQPREGIYQKIAGVCYRNNATPNLGEQPGRLPCGRQSSFFPLWTFSLDIWKIQHSLNVVQRLASTSIYPTGLAEMTEEGNFRAKAVFDRVSDSALDSWKVGTQEGTVGIIESTTPLWLWENWSQSSEEIHLRSCTDG